MTLAESSLKDATPVHGNGALPIVGDGRSPRGNNGVADAALMAEARRLIEQTKLSQTIIAFRLGIAPSTLSVWKLREGWTRPAGAPLAPRINGEAGRRDGQAIDKAAARRKRMIERLYKTFERQVAAIETRLWSKGTEVLEKDARTLGALAKTLETLTALDRDDGARAREQEPVDRGELRAELARRIAAWAGEGNRERQERA